MSLDPQNHSSEDLCGELSVELCFHFFRLRSSYPLVISMSSSLLLQASKWWEEFGFWLMVEGRQRLLPLSRLCGCRENSWSPSQITNVTKTVETQLCGPQCADYGWAWNFVYLTLLEQDLSCVIPGYS